MLASVAMNGVTPSLVTTRPLATPTTSPTRTPATSAVVVLLPSRMTVQVTAPVSATVAPTDRSNSPIVMHRVIARPGTTMMLAATRMFSRLVPVRKLGAKIANPTKTRISGGSSGRPASVPLII